MLSLPSYGPVYPPYIFDFRRKLTALPPELVALGATYTRASEKRVVQDGALVTLAANQFGTWQDPVTGLYGYRPEPAATNLATNSDGTVTQYSVYNNVVNGAAVPGFNNGIAFGDNSILRQLAKQLTTTAGTVYSVSVYVVMDDGRAPIVGTTTTTGDMSLIADNSLAATTALVERLGSSGVYRISTSITAAGGTGRSFGIYKYTGQSARTFRVTGIQVETGAVATSYIPTGASTATRAADVPSVQLANLAGFNAAWYTLFFDARFVVLPPSGVSAAFAAVHDMSNNRAVCYYNGGLAQTSTIVVRSGVTEATLFGPAPGTSRFKYSASITNSNFRFSQSGVDGTPALSGRVPLSPTALSIGANQVGANQFNGFIFRAGLIPTALTQAQLNGLTA